MFLYSFFSQTLTLEGGNFQNYKYKEYDTFKI